MSTRFLITGAQGFVGRYLTAHLLANRSDVEVTGIGRSAELRDSFTHSILWAGERLAAPLPDDLACLARHHAYRYVPIDLEARTVLTGALRSYRPHVVIHLAAALRDDPPADLARTNVEATGSLIEAMADTGADVRRLIICSTGAVYGAPDTSGLPFDEGTACHPLNPYAESKLAGERLSRKLARRYGIDTVWARVFNIVGPGEDDRHAGPEFARQAAEILHRVRPPVIEVGSLDATRDFVDVRDVATALTILADRATAGEVYNVASGAETSIRSLLGLVLDRAGLEGRVEICRRPGVDTEPKRHVADVRRLRALGFVPGVELGTSAKDMIEYYRVRVAAVAAERARV